METMKRTGLFRALLALGLLLLCAALLPTLALAAGAQTTDCNCDNGYVNGFCEECGYQPATLNKGEDLEGTYDDVYEIGNMGQLYWLADLLRTKAPATFVSARLTADITVNTGVLNADGTLAGTPARIWMPFGFVVEDGAVTDIKTVQNVNLDGAGHYISGLYAVSEAGEPVGLFGKTEDVFIRNLGIADSYFSSSYYTGAFVGEVIDHTEITHCFARVGVAGGTAAGLVGKLGYVSEPSVLQNCYTTAALAVYESDAQNTVAQCHYLAAAESDALDGTAFFPAADLTSGALLEALRTADDAWYQSCVSAMPQLLPEHNYKYACDRDCRTEGCGDTARTDYVPHEYDNGCDTTCNICQRIRQVGDHVYSDPCDATCNECQTPRVLDGTQHKYSNQCDTSCNYCQNERTVPGHSYTNACDKLCNYCNAEREVPAHVYDNSCDEFCNVCGTMRGDTHTYSFACDENCDVCGKIRSASHTWVSVVTREPGHFEKGEELRTCQVCGKTETVEIEELPGWPLWLTLLVSIGGGVVLLSGGFLVYWCLIKKRTLAQLFGRSPEQLERKERQKRTEDNRRRKQEKKEAKKADAAEAEAEVKTENEAENAGAEQTPGEDTEK